MYLGSPFICVCCDAKGTELNEETGDVDSHLAAGDLKAKLLGMDIIRCVGSTIDVVDMSGTLSRVLHHSLRYASQSCGHEYHHQLVSSNGRWQGGRSVFLCSTNLWIV